VLDRDTDSDGDSDFDLESWRFLPEKVREAIGQLRIKHSFMARAGF
jgi:hypothetical protein